jgi:excinuclease ABC subunit A
MIIESDYVIDIGPGAGVHGGRVIAAATPKEMLKFDTMTANYITGKINIEIPKTRRKGNGKKDRSKGMYRS